MTYPGATAIDESLADGDPAPAAPICERPPRLHTVRIKVPSFRIADMQSVRNQLRRALDPSWLGQEITPAHVLPAVSKCLPRLPKDHLYITMVNHLGGQPLTGEYWEYLATRLAGNIPWIKKAPLPSSCRLEYAGQWALLETLEAMPSVTKKGAKGYRLTYRSRTGLSAGHFISRFFSRNALGVYGKHIGIRKLGWSHHRAFMATNVLALLKTAKKAEFAYFDDYRASPSCKQINRWLTKGRSEPCIKGRLHDCWVCTDGLRDDDSQRQCRYAVHLRALEKRICPECGNKNPFRHDPQESFDGSPVCLRCEERLARRGHQEARSNAVL